jgi:hypothetical protein
MRPLDDNLLHMSPLSLVYIDDVESVVACNEDELNKAVLEWIKPGHKWWRRWRNPKTHKWEYEYLDFNKHPPKVSVSEHKTNTNLFNVNIIAPAGAKVGSPELAEVRKTQGKLKTALGSLVTAAGDGSYDVPSHAADVLHSHFSDDEIEVGK